MAIKTKNNQIAAETRAMQKISQILDAFPPARQAHILGYLSDSLDAASEQIVEFPIQTN